MLLAVGVLVPPSSEAAPKCRRVPERLAKKRTADVTGKLQSVLSKVPNGGCLKFPRRAKYRVEGTLELVERVGITIRGAGATLYAKSRPGDLDPTPKAEWRQHLAIWGGSDITIQNLRIRGPNRGCGYDQPHEGEAGVLVKGATNVRLLDLVITQTSGDAFEIGDWGVDRPARDVSILGGSFQCIGRMGVGLTSEARNILVETATFDGIARSVIDIEPIPDRHVEGVVIRGNTVGPHGHMLLAGGGWGTKSQVFLVGNRTTTQPLRVKYVGGGLTLEGNVGWGLAINPIVAAVDGDEIRLIGNVQHVFGGPDKNGVTIPAVSFPSNVCDAYAAGNDFTGAISLYDELVPPPPPPCSWVDGGGNAL